MPLEILIVVVTVVFVAGVTTSATALGFAQTTATAP
jgi:hypothetical protein